MSKIHINKVGVSPKEEYDSISFGEKIFVEEMPRQNIPPDYERIDTPQEKPKQSKSKFKNENSFDNFLKTSVRILSFSAIAFIIYSLFGGLLDNSELALQPLGKEVGITFGIFAVVSIFAILFLFSKTKINIFVENGLLHIKSFRGLNHIIPIESIADCKINIFEKAYSIKTFISFKHYKIDLEAGVLITFKDGKNLLIASSNSHQTHKNLVFS